ncbi:hypothetical protein PENARI_c016G11280 [Penicillium arizonense]|uniref:Uncharacterized protein n=1 Tax=Penicillium arizonense TaxID=1835702 RepID=A0A1F5LCB2_PENAI|nr:hypothetical protein PENARI_c016G11280 [Penicillium arizonense]OGE50630.1 hypothetical protein PENARI_c016G11280 [Penicillium arizonense]
MAPGLINGKAEYKIKRTLDCQNRPLSRFKPPISGVNMDAPDLA